MRASAAAAHAEIRMRYSCLGRSGRAGRSAPLTFTTLRTAELKRILRHRFGGHFPLSREGISALVVMVEHHIQRRAAGIQTRVQWEANSKTHTKPWEVMGLSRATWYRKGCPMLHSHHETGLSAIKLDKILTADAPVSQVKKTAPSALRVLAHAPKNGILECKIASLPCAIAMGAHEYVKRGPNRDVTQQSARCRLRRLPRCVLPGRDPNVAT